MSSTYSPLLTDLYQLTMAYGYWRLNMHEQEATFHLFFRNNPFNSNHAVNCGLASVVDFLRDWRFQSDDLDYLSTLKNTANEPLFPTDFLHYLKQLRFTCDLDAIPEGTVVFPQEPLIRIQGPLLQCQLLETPLLNFMNFQTLIATKSSRICRAAAGDPVIDFGMRRAQGPDGALSASRAAYIGGCIATSNTLAGKLFDIPVRGTHAHSWVTAFPTELQAFTAYADVMPHNAVLLVDTYNTIEGVKHAITVGKQLREQQADLLAIRLDSGDMATLSIEARKLLDAAGFNKTDIIASNSLNEYEIARLKQQGAAISSWGVGTHLVTAYDQPALDGIYKLSALRNKEGLWESKLKLSEQTAKISNPGRHQVRRYIDDKQPVRDIIYDLDLGITETNEPYIDLLIPIIRQGNLIQSLPSIHEIRERAMTSTANFYHQHSENIYPVELEEKLKTLKETLINRFK